MPLVELDQDILDHLKSEVRDFGETPSSVLRRLLGLNRGTAPEIAEPRQPPDPPAIHVDPPPCPPTTAPGHQSSTTRNQAPNADQTAIISPHEVDAARHAIDRFMLILKKLYLWSPERFVAVERVKGRRRIYFSRSVAEVAAAGNAVNPQRIQGTPYFVATNLSNDRKVAIMNEVLTLLQVPFPKRPELIRILNTQNMIHQPIELPPLPETMEEKGAIDDDQI